MNEHDIQNQIRIALSEHGIVFRTNSGDFWQGERRYSREFKQDVLINLRRVEGLPKGFTDLLFIGEGKVAFLEVKTPEGRIGTQQKLFIEKMKKLQHSAGVVRNVEAALKLIKED